MNPGVLRSVQALRGLAALSVMLFHFRFNLNATWPGLGDKLFIWGASGVDLFFLISGFVITLTIKKTPADFSGVLTFFKRRALRILPAYYVILLLTFFLSGAMSVFHYSDKTLNFISSLIFQPAYTNNAPFYIDDSGMYNIRWTLNYEIYFYLAIGVLALIPMRLFAFAGYFILTLIVLPLACGQTFTLSPAGYDLGIKQLNLITNPIIFLFLAGMVLGYLYPLLLRANGRVMAVLLAVSLGMTIWFFSNGQYQGHGVLSSGWLYFLILAFAIGAEKTLGRYVPDVLVRLGDISFSLYLIHTLVNKTLRKRLEGVGMEPGLLMFIAAIVLALLFAWLSWRYIEKPFQAKRAGRSPLQKAS
ncbi:acyltransferase [Enterobacter sp.]|uniref:acyltransferase family protein n=1 Tax=Enterobacter sp. TaxID=42895 RepID=UPI002980D333|nr:acyltransferase [Enterobacter sp.]